MKAFLLGGLAWFAIPFMFATTLGLSAVALRGDPAMRVLSPEDVSAGLPASAAAAALLGEAGAVCVLIVIFLAITSATSAELIAVSSILTYDVYQVRDQLLDDVWFLLLRGYWVSCFRNISTHRLRRRRY